MEEDGALVGGEGFGGRGMISSWEGAGRDDGSRVDEGSEGLRESEEGEWEVRSSEGEGESKVGVGEESSRLGDMGSEGIRVTG